MTNVIFEIKKSYHGHVIALLKGHRAKDLSEGELRRTLTPFQYDCAKRLIARGLTIDILNEAEFRMQDEGAKL